MNMKNKKSYRSRAIRKHIIDRLLQNSVLTIEIDGVVKKLTQLKLNVLKECYLDFFGEDPFLYMVKNNHQDQKFNLLDSIYKDYKRTKEIQDLKKVYVIGNFEYGFCKIGVSCNPELRKKQIQTGCPFKLEVLKVFIGNEEIERLLHKKYSKYKSQGEWFFIKGSLKDAINTF